MAEEQQHGTSDEDFNIPSAQRQHLLSQLHSLIGEVPVHFWAACHLCDIQHLEVFVQIAAQFGPGYVQFMALSCPSMVRIWCQTKHASSSSTSSSRGTPSPNPSLRSSLAMTSNRSVTARENALKRDSEHCVLTGKSSPQICHIYPFSLLGPSSQQIGLRKELWKVLKCFWPESKIAACENVLFPGGFSNAGRDIVANLISLSPDAHSQWNKGEFALKPVEISTDCKTLKVQFFWQSDLRENVNLSSGETASFLTRPEPTRGFYGYRGTSDSFLYNGQALIRTGDIFTLTTNNPATHPLPSFELLEMQWFLNRLRGIAGAAEPKDEHYWDDYDDVSDIDLDDMTNESCVSELSP